MNNEELKGKQRKLSKDSRTVGLAVESSTDFSVCARRRNKAEKVFFG